MTEKTIIDSFKGVNNKVEAGSTTKDLMRKIFKEYADSTFVQKDFVERLGKRNAMINRILHELMAEGAIERVGSAKQYFYKLKK